MKTVVLGSWPAELEALMERRRAQGLDRYDEVWEGVYQVVPSAGFRHAYLDRALAVLLEPLAGSAGLIGSGPFNLGEADDFRVPDGGLHRQFVDAVYLDTAAMVIEIVSPDDETYQKLPFYAAHQVDEVLVVEPDERRVRLFCLEDGAYVEAPRSELLNVESTELEASIRWL